MQKVSSVFVFFVLMIVVLGGCVPATFINPAHVNVDPGDNITDVSIAIDGNGMKHIVGIKDDRVVYFRGNIGEPTYQFTIGWGYLLPGTDTSDWSQHKPEIAVQSNGTAHIVWYEEYGDPSQKTACYLEVAPAYDPTSLEYCHPLDVSDGYTTGLVRVAAKGNVAYAVYDRIDTDGYVESVWYKKLEELTTTGLVVNYTVVTEDAYINTFDMAIDDNGNLHIAYIDLATYTPNPRLWYRSNATTKPDYSMNQIWAIASGTSLQKDVQPSIHFYKDEFVMITSVWEFDGNQGIFVDRCNIIGCADQISKLPTFSLDDWDSSSEFLEVKGMGISDDYFLSFIAHNEKSSDYQVWYWAYTFPGDPVQITDSSYVKSQLKMVDSPFPIIGYLESWESDGLLSTYVDRVSIYDEEYGVREVKKSFCPGLIKNKSSDMASYVDLMTDSVPVAGVWNVCNKTWFSTNAFMIDLPLIMK